jgi:hypothetical protein
LESSVVDFGQEVACNHLEEINMTGISANQANLQIGRPAPPFYPHPHFTENRQTFGDQLLHPDRIYGFGGYGGFQAPRGFGMDLNGDGKFDSKKDGFLSFDLNRDGQHTDQEIQQSRNLLKAFSGNFDTNADGRLDYNEFFQGYSNYFQARSMDLDRDGVLSNWELQRAGGSVVKERQNGPRRPGQTNWRSISLDNLPGGRRLGQLNPWNGSYTSSFNWSHISQPHVLPPVAQEPAVRQFSDMPNA